MTEPYVYKLERRPPPKTVFLLLMLAQESQRSYKKVLEEYRKLGHNARGPFLAEIEKHLPSNIRNLPWHLTDARNL